MQNENFRKYGIPALAFILTFVLLYTNLFYTWDKILSDAVCQTGDVPDNRIFIVAIDDKTLEKGVDCCFGLGRTADPSGWENHVIP